VVQLGGQHGYRNAQATVLAPTGTIGLLMDCDTTGIEPDFALVKFKKLAGGGYFKIVNQSVPGALRKLVEHAMRANAGKDRIRASQNAAYRFMSAMAGNRVRFEDAARALFAGDAATFNRLVQAWPKDIRDHATRLAAAALKTENDAA
jgi:ribonucleotide reductase alpha subunit